MNTFSLKLGLLIIALSSLPLSAKKKKMFPEIENFIQESQINNGHILLKSSLSYTVPLPAELDNFKKITEEVFVNLVNDNHPDIIQAKLDRQSALAQRIEAQGAFDPSLSADGFYNRFNSSSAIGDVQEAFTSNTSINWLSGYGAKFSLGSKLALGDIKTPLSPTGDAGEYFLKLQVPLLRNAIYNEQNVKEQQAKIKETIADFKLNQKKLEILSKSIQKYWFWIGAFQKLVAEQRLFKLNSEQAKQVEEQVKYGSLANIDHIEILREVQKRRGKVATETASYQQKAIELTSFLWKDNGEPYPIASSKNIPEIDLLTLNYQEPDILEAKLTALEKRPEFKSLNKFKEVVDWNRKFAKNQYLPELNAYGYQGVEVGGGSIGPTTQAGIELMLPFRNRRASGKLQQAKIDMSKLNVQEKQLAQFVFLEVENASQILKNSYDAYQAAKEELGFAEKLAIGEKDKFDLGSSTIFLVIRRQRSLVDAQINLIESFTNFHIAKVNFKFSQGLLQI
jgi:outer membrane protein